jgi:hypothetical protein
MKYHQHLNYRRRKRFIRRVRIAVFLVVVAAVGLAAFIFYDNFRTGNLNTPEQTTSAQTTSYIAPNIQIFTTPYFQIQTKKSWSEDPSASTANKFIYRNMHGGLLEQMITVYVNSPPSDLASTRVLETSLNGSSGLKVEKMSEHCGKGTKNVGTKQITLDKVTFKCFADDTRYNVLVGLIGGSSNITLQRPKGGTAAYTIYYSNLTALPDYQEVTDIINSFQAR